MPNNVIDVCYSESRRSKTRHAYQYDYGQKLAFSGFDLPDAFEVHFATDTGSITQIGTDNQVTIPDACFTAAKSVSAWLYLHEGETDGETRYEIEIPVRPRAAITREEPTPVQQDAIDQAIAALQSAVEKTGEAQQAAEDAAESVKNAGATAETLSPGSPATVVVRDVEGVKTFEFGIPEGRKGETGETPNFTVGSVTTLPAGSPVTVTITGTDENPVLNIGIPQGAQGDKGDTGAVPHFTIGTVTTLPPNSPATVTVTGTDENPILNLGIPKGIQGQKGDKGDAFTYADFTEEQKAELIQGPIQTAQSAAVAAVQNAGAAQVQSVESKGQEVRDSIPSDYSALSDDVNSLKSAITELEPRVDSLEINKADIIVSSASGSIASFSDGADGMPVKELSVAIEPVQDLHGYDSPWPAGGGKNLFGGEYGTKWLLPTPLSISAGDQLAISASVPASGNSRINIYTGENGATRYFNAGVNDTVNGRKVRIATFAEDITITAFLMDVAECTDIQIEKGSTATDYAPYSNICHISGWDVVKVTRAGKNLLDESLFDTSTGGNMVYRNFPAKNGTYTMSSSDFPAVSNVTNVFFLAGNVSTGASSSTNGVWESKACTITVTDGYYTIAYRNPVSSSTNTNDPKNFHFQIEFGSEANAYEAYVSPQTYSITLPSEAGTVYGGELTVNEDGTGQVVVDRAYRQMTAAVLATFGESNRGYYSSVAQLGGSPGVWFRNMFNSDGAKSRQVGGIKANCNAFPITMNNSSVISSQNRTVFGVDGTNINSVETFIAAVQALENGGSGLFIAYELAAPLSYTLTVSQVTTILGTNNAWADAGDTTVQYRADTKLYIDNKITEAIANALNA